MEKITVNNISTTGLVTVSEMVKDVENKERRALCVRILSDTLAQIVLSSKFLGKEVDEEYVQNKLNDCRDDILNMTDDEVDKAIQIILDESVTRNYSKMSKEAFVNCYGKARDLYIDSLNGRKAAILTKHNM